MEWEKGVTASNRSLQVIWWKREPKLNNQKLKSLRSYRTHGKRSVWRVYTKVGKGKKTRWVNRLENGYKKVLCRTRRRESSIQSLLFSTDSKSYTTLQVDVKITGNCVTLHFALWCQCACMCVSEWASLKNKRSWIVPYTTNTTPHQTVIIKLISRSADILCMVLEWEKKKVAVQESVKNTGRHVKWSISAPWGIQVTDAWNAVSRKPSRCSGLLFNVCLPSVTAAICCSVSVKEKKIRSPPVTGWLSEIQQKISSNMFLLFAVLKRFKRLNCSPAF